MVVERTASPCAPGTGAAVAAGAALGSAQTVEGERGDYYAEEERFWRERCPPGETAAADRREKEPSAAAAASPRQPPLGGSSAGAAQTAVGRAANYDYFSAQAAYRSSPRNRVAADPLYCNSEPDGFGGGGRGGSSHRRTGFDREGGDGLGDADNPPLTPNHQPPEPPRRQGSRDWRGVQDAESVRKRNTERRRRSRSRSRSLRKAEAVLHEVLGSVEGGLTTIEVLRRDVRFYC